MPPSTLSSPVPGVAGAHGTVTVLAVDDDPAVLELTARRLERADDRFVVETETSPSAALERLESGRVDCVLSDYDMPERDGLALLEAVRDREPDLPFVLFTAAGSEAIASEAIAAGVTDYLRKGAGPDQYAALANRIASAVAHHRTRREHRRTEALLMDVADSIDECVFAIDRDGGLTWANAAFARVFGRPAHVARDDIRAVLDHVPASDRTAVAAWFDRVAADLEADDLDDEYATEFRYDPPGTDRRRLRVSLSPAADGVERPTRLVGVASDVTDDERRLAELRRSEERLRGIAEASNDVIFRVDAAGELTYASPATEAMLGYDPAAYDAPDFLDFLDEADHERAVATFERVLEGESIDGLEVVAEGADGRRVTLEVNATPIRADGEIVGAQGVASDVTDRKARAAELEQYETIVETVPDGVFVIDADGDVVRGNESAAAMLGYETGEVVGRPFSYLIEEGVFGPESVDVYLEGVREMLSSTSDRDRARYELEAQVDGETRVIEVHLALRPFEETFEGTIGVFRDVTERHEYERRLERQNERLDRFASMISHDLRNPLNVATGSLALAREACSCGSGSDRLEDVARAHERIDGLIDDVLALARQGEGVADLTAVDVAAVADRAWASVAPSESDSRLVVADDVGVIAADEARARRLLENLFRNAIEHGTAARASREGPPGAGVSVRVGRLDDGGLYVEDDGPGVPPDERASVFEYGYSTGDSTGLGLTIVEEIAAAHGWSVSVTDGAAGGARFEIGGVERS